MAQGVTSSTPGNLVIGAGVVFRDGAVVGASMDTNAFTIEQEWADIDLNGVPGKLMGTDYILSEMARLETTIPEVSASILASTWPHSDSATVGTVTTIDSDGSRRVATADYSDWILQVDGLDGRQFNFYADNALNVDGVSMEATDDGAMAPRLNLETRWDAADLTASPHRITIITGVSS
jgi:hypothetical protein